MFRPGCSSGLECWDNAQHESFWSTLKTEFYDHHEFATHAQAIQDISTWIETVYNRRRRHSTLGQIPPVTYEHQGHHHGQPGRLTDAHQTGSTPSKHSPWSSNAKQPSEETDGEALNRARAARFPRGNRMGIVYDVSVVLFEDFELLDVFGPVELLARLPEEYRIVYVAPEAGPVRSSQGAEIVVPASLKNAAPTDIVLVPGGPGTRRLVRDQQFLQMLTHLAAPAAIIVSVCTGSAVLAAAGLLNGYRATSNKRAFDWASGHGDGVTWVRRARWVHDRNRWTSSGVAAGMDMTAALIGHLTGPEAATTAAREIELEIHPDPTRDPFADPR